MNQHLSANLDVEAFFFSVRPYYKPHVVDGCEYRGANAGDFAAFTEVDLTLGLCRMSDPAYASLVAQKLPYLVPEDQRRLRAATLGTSLLDEFLAVSQAAADQPWYRSHGAAFLEVCAALGAAAAYHHNNLIRRFISEPAAATPPEDQQSLTASGPPLHEVLNDLHRLRDQRLAAPRKDIPTRHDDLQTLRELVTTS